MVYVCAEASQETVLAMRDRCLREGHCFEKLELSDRTIVKKCFWCGAAVTWLKPTPNESVAEI